MAETYYFDSCIWRDHYENRFGPNGRPLGKYATELFSKIMKNKDTLLISKLVYNELTIAFSKKEIDEMMTLLTKIGALQRINISEEQQIEAKKISIERNVSRNDALHAILARDNNAILVSQNEKDFKLLKDIKEFIKPDNIK